MGHQHSLHLPMVWSQHDHHLHTTPSTTTSFSHNDLPCFHTLFACKRFWQPINSQYALSLAVAGDLTSGDEDNSPRYESSLPLLPNDNRHLCHQNIFFPTMMVVSHLSSHQPQSRYNSLTTWTSCCYYKDSYLNRKSQHQANYTKKSFFNSIFFLLASS